MNCVIDMPICSINPLTPEPGIIRRAALALESGELIVAPTETRYGLLARGDSEQAIERVFAAKGRRPLQPTALFVRDEQMIHDLGEMTALAGMLLRKFLPGPLTLVLRSKVQWGSPRVVDGMIGIRWSSSPVISAIMKQVQFPVTATSANLSGSDDLDTVVQISAVLGDSVSLYLDGRTLTGPASTVVRCVDDQVTILREGAITVSDIHAAISSGERS